MGYEDEVYRAAGAYVEGRGGDLTEEEQRGVWECVRFAWCSAEVQVMVYMHHDVFLISLHRGHFAAQDKSRHLRSSLESTEACDAGAYILRCMGVCMRI